MKTKKNKTYRVWFRDGGAILVNATNFAEAEKLTLEKNEHESGSIVKIEDITTRK